MTDENRIELERMRVLTESMERVSREYIDQLWKVADALDELNVKVMETVRVIRAGRHSIAKLN
jgi:hypothetical protein